MNKAALVTGAAKRIGAQIARSLHRSGYCVAVNYKTSAAAAHALVESLNSERPRSAIAVQADITHPDAAAALIATVSETWGRLDLLVNNASIYEPNSIDTLEADLFDRIVAANLRAPYLLSTAAVPVLRRAGGTIVNLTDIYAMRPQPGYAVYCASKAGLIGLTKAMARDLAPVIRVNGVSPGPIVWGDEHTLEHRTEVLGNTPLGRLGAATDIADAVCYLAEAPYVTGQILEVDGGRSIFI